MWLNPTAVDLNPLMEQYEGLASPEISVVDVAENPPTSPIEDSDESVALPAQRSRPKKTAATRNHQRIAKFAIAKQSNRVKKLQVASLGPPTKCDQSPIVISDD